MPMKVIVCFDEVRVTVPCGDGEILVSELITKAVHRYKRATGKGGDVSVTVNSLKTISGGGILDPDDQLSDVVDDREQLIAEFDEPGRVRQSPLSHSYPLHNGGDGGTTASSCSAGTISPELFQSCDLSIVSPASTAITVPPFVPTRNNHHHHHHNHHNHHHHNSSSSASSSTNNTNPAATDVVVTPRDLTLGSTLRVRRGSDPGLNILDSLVKEASFNKPIVPTRPSITRRESVRESDDPRSESSEDEKKMKMAAYGSLDRKRFSHKFTRDITRASLSNRPEMAQWMEAQEKRLEATKLQKVDITRSGDEIGEKKSILEENRTTVTILNDGGPLGIHAVPAYDDSGQAMGLLIQSVEPGRPVDRDGRIQTSDVVLGINGMDLYNVPFLRAQEMFRSAMQSSEIELSVIKGRDPSRPTSPSASDTSSFNSLPKAKRQAPPPPVMPKPRSHIPKKPSPLTLPTSQRLNPLTPTQSSDRNGVHDATTPDQNKIDVVVPVPLPPRQPLQEPSSPTSPPSAKPAIHHHRHSSLNSSSSSCSSSHNNGDLKPPAPSTFKHQSNGVTSFTSPTNTTIIKPGPPIRPPKKAPAPAVPSRSPKTAITSSPSNAPSEAAININALTNTRRIGKCIDIQLKKGALGLGFSVTSRDNLTDGDCPIYIRNILPKGAAIQDGRLRIGDRLMEVNGVEMTGKNQAEAVALLRMLQEGSLVDLVVSRQEEVDERFKVPRQLPTTAGVSDLDSPPGFTKEKIILRIPLNDTGSAGLGVSVKGKTQPKDESGEVEDSGIFVKTVLQGGAASKHGQLMVNDQLLGVNGINLVGVSNTTAMDALRSAMIDNGQSPGSHITLTVARLSGGPGGPPLFQYSDDAATSESTSPGDFVFPRYPRNAGDSVSGNSVFHQRSSSTNDTSSQISALTENNDMPSPIPPVRSKKVGQLRDKFNELGDAVNAFRNESYFKATHESMNDSSAFTNVMPSPRQPSEPLKPSNSLSEYDDRDVYAVSSKMQRPHSTIGFLHGPKMSQSSVSDDEAFRRASTASSKDDSDLSPQGEPVLPFAREGFGRQSMSEKRKGHIDPRSMEVYKQAKANKENKGGFLNRRVRSFHVTGTPQPSTQPAVQPYTMVTPKVKRSSSVEDLPNTDQKTSIAPTLSNSSAMQVRELSPNTRTNRFGRARACNDSFRAAVDRSYDILDPALMDTLEEESMESGPFTLDPPRSGPSSLSSSENTQEDSNSLKRQKAKDKDKKGGGGGLLKGFLRFGKGRKSNEEALRRSRSEERSANKNNNQVSRRAEHSMDRNMAGRSRSQWEGGDGADDNEHGFYPVSQDSNQPYQQHRRRASQQDNERIEEEYARLRDHHVTEQRLRSQSVDPAAGRAGSRGVVVYPDRSSPFQPYVGSAQQPQQQQQQSVTGGYNNSGHQDPRLFHPASLPDSGGSLPRGEAGWQQDNGGRESPHAQSTITKANVSRAEKIQQLRSMYQHKHRQNQGVYPLDDTEEQYEQQIRQLEQKWATGNPGYDRDKAESPLSFERPRPDSRGHPPGRSYGSSPNVNNVNSSIATSSTAAYNHHQLHYTNSNSSTSSSSNNRQPRSRPQSRGSSSTGYPSQGGGGGGSRGGPPPHHYQPLDNAPVDSYHYHPSHHPQQAHHYQQQHQQQHQQPSHHPHQHHSLPNHHRPFVDKGQEEVTSFSGYHYNYDNRHHNQLQRRTSYSDSDKGSGGGGGGGQPPYSQHSSSPSPNNYFSSSLPYPPNHHHHYHQGGSTHPDPAKV